MKKFLLRGLLSLSTLFIADNTFAQCTATAVANNITQCVGDTLILNAQPAGQPGYQWYKDGNPVSGNQAEYVEGLTTPGTYTFYVDVTDANSCVASSNPIVVTVGQSPTVSISNNGPVCAGGTLQLSSTGSNILSYSWTGPGGFISTQANPSIPNAQPMNGGLYQLTVSNGGCTANDYTVAVVNAVPSINVTAPNGGACQGDSLFLISGFSGGTNPTFMWTGPNGFTSTSNYTGIANAQPMHAGTYNLTVTATGCNGPVTLTGSVNVAIGTPVPVSASNNGPVCEGQTLQLAGTTTASSYSWSGPGGFTSTQLNPSISNLQYNQGGYYTLTANNNGCPTTATTQVIVNGIGSIAASGPLAACLGQSINITTVVSDLTNVTYVWDGPNSYTATTANAHIPSVTLADEGFYHVEVTGTDCAGNTDVDDTYFYLNVAACDSVYPGDANSDFIANNQDILHLGVLYGETGPARNAPSINWLGEYCNDWANSTNAVNHKHADCNGDGVVNAQDADAVTQNYGYMHYKGTNNQAKSSAFPDLYFDMGGIALGAGGTVTIPIKLGNSALSLNDVYGVAAEVAISGITPADPLLVESNISWMGNSSNSMSFTHASTTDQTDWTIVRTDHNNTNGNGTIGSLTFTVPVGTEYQQVTLSFNNVVIINKDGDVLTDYNILDANVLVYPLSVHTTAGNVNHAAVVPNPSDANASLQLSLATDTKVQITVTDITGRNIWNTTQNATAGTSTISLPASELAPGMYSIQVRDEKGLVTQNLKWIRK